MTIDAPYNILIVDDDRISRAMFKRMLALNTQTIHLAESVIAARRIMDDITPDVILLDVIMPETNGLSFCRELKASAKWQHVPIILLTAQTGNDAVVEGLDAGADEFISKPVTPAVLQARVRSMLRIKQQYDELKGMLTMREDLAHMIVHDMRTPLAALKLHVDILKRKQPTEAQLKNVAAIDSQTVELQRFATDLLTVAKTERQQLVLTKSAVIIPNLIAQVVSSHTMIAKNRQLTIEIEQTADNACTATLDDTLLRRVLDNLLSNAIKFSPTNSTITLSHACQDDHLILTVADEGKGIAPEHRERIFNKYEIVPLKAEGVSQTGLGLAFCKLVSEAHGGTIHVTESPSGGAKFVVTLPHTT